MAASKLYITNERMLKLMDWYLQQGRADNETQYMELIDFPRSNINNVRGNIQFFTREQIYNACKLTGASADFIYGFTNVMMRSPGKKGIDQLREAMVTVELELTTNDKSGNKNGNRTGREIKKQKLKHATGKRLVK